MRRALISLALAALAAAAWGAVRMTGGPQGRPAASILADYSGVRSPSWMEGDDPEEVAAFERAVRDGARKQAAFALEMWRTHPAHERTPELLLSRWRLLCNALELHAAVDEEATHVLRSSSDPNIDRVARWGRAHARVDVAGLAFAERLESIVDAAESDPENPSGPYLLHRLAMEHGEENGMFASTLALIVERFPQSSEAANARLALAVVERIGEPFTASVRDERSGVVWNSSDVAGRPFVWHTWRYHHGEELRACLERIASFRRANDGIDVVSVCFEPKFVTDESLTAALASPGADWPFLVPSESAAEQLLSDWRVPRFEWFTLIGADGRVLATATDPQLLIRK